MIDIHTHILPGVDDGAQDIYDSLEMARVAVDSGTTTIIATPHCNIPEVYDNYFSDDYVNRIHSLQRAMKRENIPVTILPGMEVYSTDNMPKLLTDGKIMTLNQGRYLLMEFDFKEDPEFAFDILERVAATGAKPVIAHAERYEFVQYDPQIAYEWRRMGYQIQINKGSFMGKFGRGAERAAYQMMSHNLVTCIASDAHSAIQRTPYMLDAYRELAKRYPTKLLDILFDENPRRILESRPILRFELKSFLEEDGEEDF